MKFARIAIAIAAVVVVDAVRNVRRLLNLGDMIAAANAMHTSRRNEKHIAALHLHLVEDAQETTAIECVEIFSLAHLTIETIDEFRARCAVEHIPHLRLAKRIVAFRSQFVARMHLHRKTVASVDKLDEQRKLVAKLLINTVAHEVAHINFKQFVERIASQKTIGNHRHVAFHARNLPSLAAPNLGLYDGLKLNWIQIIFHKVN